MITHYFVWFQVIFGEKCCEWENNKKIHKNTTQKYELIYKLEIRIANIDFCIAVKNKMKSKYLYIPLAN